MKKLYAVVLLYNVSISDSITCKNLKKIRAENLKIIILDNSTKNFHNDEICQKEGYIYINMGGNRGISIAYNKAIDFLLTIENTIEEDYIIWLDDDTEITEEYFKILNKEIINKVDVDIFAPIVYGQDGIIYSPNKAGFIKNKLVKNEKDIENITKFNAINSCLCVKLKVYSNYKYDEILFLDQTDQNFFDDMRLRRAKFCVLNTVIHQNFSQRGENLNPQKMLLRYEIRVKDIMRYGRKSILNTIKSLIKSCGLAVQMGIKCRYLRIVTRCFGIAIKMFFYNIRNLITRRVK